MDKEEMDRNNKIINWVCEDLIVRKMLDDKVFEPLGIERALDLAINKAREEGRKAKAKEIYKKIISSGRCSDCKCEEDKCVEMHFIYNIFDLTEEEEDEIEKELKKENKNV